MMSPISYSSESTKIEQMAKYNYTVAPGEYLEEWVEDSVLTKDELARELNLRNSELSALLKGDLPLGSLLADQLETLTKIPARVWEAYEKSFREELESIRLKGWTK